MASLFPAIGERIPYALFTREQQHALHTWLDDHGVPHGRVPVYAELEHDVATGEWRIPVYWHDTDGRMRLNPDGETVRKHVVRRRELRPLPWPTYGPKRWDADDLIPGQYVCTCDEPGRCYHGDDCDGSGPECEPDDDAGHGDDRPPIVTVDTGGLL